MGSPTTSSRILNAAIDLFSTNAYSEISVDEIAQKAGLTKMTLYQHYKSKDRLLLACLKARLERREMKLDLFLEGLSPKADPLLAIFDWLEGWLNPTNFKGCAFVKAFNELSVIIPEVRGIALEAKEKIQKRLTSLAKKTNRSNPSTLGEELALLFEGAQSLALVQGSARPAKVARRIASAILNG
jgi:AcrR family transcriptional regulator